MTLLGLSFWTPTFSLHLLHLPRTLSLGSNPLFCIIGTLLLFYFSDGLLLTIGL